MSVIAVDGFPQKVSLNQAMKALFKPIGGQFKALNFHNHPTNGSKTFYLRLSEKLDPRQVIQNINEFGQKKKIHAYVPHHVPDLQVGQRRKPLPLKMRARMKISPEFTPAQIVLKAHDEIMKEIQHKFTGLYSLSNKTQHKLLENIGLTIADRLKSLLPLSEPGDLSFKLTGRYRKAHPHFGDFQLILGTLHRLEDAAGTPRTQIMESDLTVTPKDLSAVGDIPFTKGSEVCNKYTENILRKLNDYVSKYDLSENPKDTEEDVVRKNVQKHITNTMPYLPNIIKQLITNHITSGSKNGLHKMRLYGEPYLPSKELCIPFLNKHRATRVLRCSSVFNALLFEVPRDQYAKIMEADGTTIGVCKLVIRTSNSNLYHLPQAVRYKIAAEVTQEFGSG